MKKKLPFLIGLMAFFIVMIIPESVYSQTYWYKMVAEIDHATEYRQSIDDEYYFKVKITSKGAMIHKIKNAKDLENSSSYGSFLSYDGKKNEMYIYVNDENMSATKYSLYISEDYNRINFVEFDKWCTGSQYVMYPPYFIMQYDYTKNNTIIGERCNEPSHLLKQSEYKMY